MCWNNVDPKILDFAQNIGSEKKIGAKFRWLSIFETMILLGKQAKKRVTEHLLGLISPRRSFLEV